ncbi:MAG: sulfotransferase family protein [Granulosicoccus sp.]
MTLQIIGSGFGRTGTMSTKLALEILGFGPTHHMTEVFKSPQQVSLWQAAIANGDVDWAEVFKGYCSQVDWPGALFWYETSIAYPNAKVIHTERAEQDWWNSYSQTIGKLTSVYKNMPLPPHVSGMFDIVKHGFDKRYLSSLNTKDEAISAYRKNNQRVRDLIPKDRLLIFNAADGWEPLCEFLGTEKPEQAFPRVHPKEQFWVELGGEPVSM